MAKCASCSTTILFGGVKDEGARYCNDDCHQSGYLLAVAEQIPDEIIQEQLQQIRNGLCPRCSSTGPVDVHQSHRIWSFLLITSWKSTPHVCCRSCGRKSQAGDAIFSLLLGWWGFPWGLLMTPVQLTRNIVGMLRTSDPYKPSPQLERIIRIHIAADALAQHEQPETAAV
jgi:hypothetical protein